MLERLCLHIGVAKTGTKTLQLAMALNGDLLRQHGFVYPALPGHHHIGLALYAANESTSARLRARIGLADGDRMAEFVGEFPSRLAAAVTSADIHTAILSNEHCSSELSTVEAISRLHALLSPLAREIRVIVYLRRQDDLAISLYSASVQAGPTNEFQFSDGHFWFNYSNCSTCGPRYSARTILSFGSSSRRRCTRAACSVISVSRSGSSHTTDCNTRQTRTRVSTSIHSNFCDASTRTCLSWPQDDPI